MSVYIQPDVLSLMKPHYVADVTRAFGPTQDTLRLEFGHCRTLTGH